MIRTKQKHIKSKEKFKHRLCLDNLMEKQFIDIIKDFELEELFKIDNFTINGIVCYIGNISYFYYNSNIKKLEIRHPFVNVFTKIFDISEMRAKSFLKRMIIKHYELDVR